MRIFFILLLIAASFLTGCAGYIARQNPEFRDAERLATQKKYNEAIQTYQKIIKESTDSALSAYALFGCASARAYYDNPRKDYVLALQEFDEFLRLYPDNEKARDARNWRYFLKTLLELRRENERATKNSEELKKNIEELKSIDIKHEERRKGK